ncbi:MAG: carboxymuconolactone decarboxylase family protein [Pseudomonadota bacterium]|nr:carboxymuconolactone decarboxylase family protein [Pseudomonadota bacterium]
MFEYPLHTLDSAPEGSRHILRQADANTTGQVNNLERILAESPITLEGFEKLNELFANSSLSALERQVVFVTAAHANHCHYCTARYPKAPDARAREVATAILNDKPIDDHRLQTLHRFTKAMTEQRGWVPEDLTWKMHDVGYTKAQLLEIVTGITIVTLASYVSHLAATPV